MLYQRVTNIRLNMDIGTFRSVRSDFAFVSHIARSSFLPFLASRRYASNKVVQISSTSFASLPVNPSSSIKASKNLTKHPGKSTKIEKAARGRGGWYCGVEGVCSVVVEALGLLDVAGGGTFLLEEDREVVVDLGLSVM